MFLHNHFHSIIESLGSLILEEVKIDNAMGIIAELVEICKELNLKVLETCTTEENFAQLDLLRSKMKKHIKLYSYEIIRRTVKSFNITDACAVCAVKMKIYERELELLPEFHGFNDILSGFSMVKGHRTIEEGHQINRQCAFLVHPTKLHKDTQGFLKLDIRIVKAGEILPQFDLTEPIDEDFIEANLIGQGEFCTKVNRSNATHTVNIYKGDGLPKLSSCLFIKYCSTESFRPQMCVRLSYFEGKTTVENSRLQNWNQSLIFTEFFPPMWSNIRIQLINYSGTNSKTLAEYCIPSSSLYVFEQANESLNFPPTFGPAYVQLYTDSGKYAGRKLVSIHTKSLETHLLENPPTRNVIVTSCEPFLEKVI